MAKRTTDQMIALDIRQVHRAGGLVPGHLSSRTWTWGSGSVSRVFLDAGIDLVTLSYRGSSQAGCGKNAASGFLWSGRPATTGEGGRGGSAQSVECVSPSCTTVGNTPAGTVTTSPSSPPGPHPGSKHFSRANKVRDRLGWGGGVASPMGDRPKGMHLTTYLRLLTELSRHGIAALPSTEKLVSQMTRKLDRFRSRGRP